MVKTRGENQFQCVFSKHLPNHDYFIVKNGENGEKTVKMMEKIVKNGEKNGEPLKSADLRNSKKIGPVLLLPWIRQETS